MSISPQQNAEISKDRILQEFSVSVHKLSDRATRTSTEFSTMLALAILVISIILLVIVSCLLAVYKYAEVKTLLILSTVIMIALVIVLAIAIEVSTVSMRNKSSRLADNAVKLLSSEQALVLLNNVAKIYNDNTP